MHSKKQEIQEHHPRPEPLWTTEDLAMMLRTTANAIRVARCKNEWQLPPAVKIGTRVYWRPQTVREWLAEREEVRE